MLEPVINYSILFPFPLAARVQLHSRLALGHFHNRHVYQSDYR